MIKHNNRISICVPVYDRPDLTIRALKSVLQQTVKPFEVIVLNDCSVEDMKEVEEFCRANGFTYQSNVKNLGLIENINKTISLAKGDFWCVLHNDDVLSPLYVEGCLNFLNKYPEFDIWVTNGCAINSTDNVIAEFRLFKKDTTIKKGKGLGLLYRRGYYTLLSIIGSTIYRTSFIKNHLFDSSWGNEADLDNALYFLTNYDIKYVDTAIYFTRIHDKQESKRLKETENKLEKYVRNRISIYKKYQNNFPGINFLGPVYATHTLQLIIKYKYPVNKVCQVLNINIVNFLNVILIDMPIFVIKQFIQKVYFSFSPVDLHDKSDTGKYDTLNYKVLNMVVETSFPNCNILDVGCWTGNLGDILKKRLSYQITIDGIENDINALKSIRDRGVYNKIYEIDLNNPPLSLNLQYDIIVLSDVLEHLINPEKTLQEISKYLSPKGWVVISLPNIAFIKYRLLHLLGGWNYKSSGVMDKTHLHFYTLDTMKALFKACNLGVVEQQPLVAIPKKYFIISLLAKIAPRIYAPQFVFKLSFSNQK